LDASITIAETDGDPGDNSFSTRINVYGSVGVERLGTEVPARHEILPSYPNPFSDVTTLEFTVATRADVEVSIYDVAGRRVGLVVDGTLDAGRYDVAYDAGRLASGVYFVSARIGDYRGSRKIVVVR
jgi:hypothetical protein